MKTKLTQYCKYYGSKGGYERNAVAYFYERKWVSLNGEFSVSEYNDCGLSDFNSSVGVPMSLKAMLLDRYLSSNGYNSHTIEMFKLWYVNYYLQSI